MSVAGVEAPVGFKAVAAGRYWFAERCFPTKVQPGDERAIGNRNKRPNQENKIEYFVRKFDVATRADMDQCCPDAQHPVCRGLLADWRIEKEHWRLDADGDWELVSPLVVLEFYFHNRVAPLKVDDHRAVGAAAALVTRLAAPTGHRDGTRSGRRGVQPRTRAEQGRAVSHCVRS